MWRPKTLLRLVSIQRVLVKHGLDEIITATHFLRPLRFFFYLFPKKSNRSDPLGKRIRLALEELGPIFVKFGQALSTRRDLLPVDIADELARLQDQVPPFPGDEAVAILNEIYEKPVDQVFARFDVEPMAAAPPGLPTVHRGQVARVPIQRCAAAWLRQALAVISRGTVVIFDYTVESYPTEADRAWLRTYSNHDEAGSPYDDPGNKDITADVDLALLTRVREPTVSGTQRDWLEKHGIVSLVEEGSAYWSEHAATPDLAAFEMRSRVTEAEALLDPAGLGSFSVVEWMVDP